MASIESTVALSVLVHGEAVRFNRGKSQADDFNFKYLRGNDGEIYPYVSSQCFKKYWRESLIGPYSPVIRGKDREGKEKNQVYTEGNPVRYVDDDLFGYMRAGADDDNQGEMPSPEESLGDLDDAAIEHLQFAITDVLNRTALLSRFKLKTKPPKSGKADAEKGTDVGDVADPKTGNQDNKDKFYHKVIDALGAQRSEYDNTGAKDEPSDALLNALVSAMNQAIAEPENHGFKPNASQKKAVSQDGKTLSQLVRDQFDQDFREALTSKSPTTKRTAPIRMHALVAFSGIKMAKDFQTFARDTALTGRDAVLNPSPPGIYSGWLKSRILIEGHRIGKFYVGEKNCEITQELLDNMGSEAPPILSENDPYSRDNKQVQRACLADDKRIVRLQQGLDALSNIGKTRGPASGALHDGSLRPKGFVGAFMCCADSPFDSVWQGTDSTPYLDERRLRDMLLDWQDLFADRKIYVGYPVELTQNAEDAQKALNESSTLEPARVAGFTFIVDTPRQALIKMKNDIKADEKDTTPTD